MAQIREIKKRRKAVSNIERITRTMQMIATVKFTNALVRAKATQPYTARIRRLVEELSAASGDVSHPLIDGPATRQNRELLLVISSDRGMCGSYNSHVLRTAFQVHADTRAGGADVDVEVSGKKGLGAVRFQGIEVTRQHKVGDTPAYDQVEEIASRYMAEFCSGTYDAMRVAFMRYESNASQVPECLQLLPLTTDAKPAGDSDSTGSSVSYEFSPSATKLLEDILPLTVKSQLFQCFNDAVVSEQIMRMVAMKGATENAKDIGKNLARLFNRARQSQITTELNEIIAGSAAIG